MGNSSVICKFICQVGRPDRDRYSEKRRYLDIRLRTDSPFTMSSRSFWARIASLWIVESYALCNLYQQTENGEVIDLTLVCDCGENIGTIVGVSPRLVVPRLRRSSAR